MARFLLCFRSSGQLAEWTVMEDLKTRAIRGGVAKLFGQVANFIVRLCFIVVMARLLDPAEFGLIAMVTAVTGLYDTTRCSFPVVASPVCHAHRSVLSATGSCDVPGASRWLDACATVVAASMPSVAARVSVLRMVFFRVFPWEIQGLHYGTEELRNKSEVCPVDIGWAEPGRYGCAP